MNQSMYGYMKVGLVAFMAYPGIMKGEGDVVETIKKIAADDYFTAIEVTWIKDPLAREQVKKILATSKMAVAYGSSPRLLTAGLNVNAVDETARQAAIASLKEGLDEAHELGAHAFSFLSGTYTEDGKEDAFRSLVGSTAELCAHAKTLGDMRVVLEVFDYDVDKKSLIGPVELAKRYAQEISKRYDNFGLMVDLSHLPLLRETPEQSILPIRDYVVHAHIGNAVCADQSYTAYGDTHPRFGFPNGANDVPELAEFLRVLLDMGFLNTENPPIVSFEVKPWADEDPDIVVANAKRTLSEAWARL
jgi:sugar phosphate isomerase/epimerase